MKIQAQNNNSHINFTRNWNQKFELPNGTKYSYFDGDDECFDSYTIRRPSCIIDDLNKCKKDLRADLSKHRLEQAIDFVESTGKYLNEKIYGITGVGGFTTTFDIGDNRVLKISKENPLEYRDHQPKFDIPLLSPIYKHNDTYAYIQAKADVQNNTRLDVLKVKLKMKKAGFISSNDFATNRTEQVGRYNGRSYLLDYRCAMKRNNTLTRFTEWFQNHFDKRRRVIQLIPIEDIMNATLEHIDETPKPNYKKKEAIGIIKKVIRSWIK